MDPDGIHWGVDEFKQILVLQENPDGFFLDEVSWN